MKGDLNFVHGQGFTDTTSQSCGVRYPALMFQPRVLSILTILGILLESGSYFLVLAAILCWNVILPRFNPFDAIYYHLVAKRTGQPRVGPAPAPRRFAQGMAGTFMLAIGLSLNSGRDSLAWTFEVLLLIALGALVLGRFCFGSWVYHLLTRNLALARRTLPWTRAE